MSKAYLIDATMRTVTETVVNGLGDLQRCVGGYIEVAYSWSNGDTLYVDEEGLLKHPSAFFAIPERTDQPLAGNGVLVGKEIGETADTRDPTMTLDKLRQRVRFLEVRS